MEEPRPKRLRISRGQDDYIAGNIVEIELHNFMTFDHLICKPGSRLNLVIGPNGSGKSSLVCAIALALGGEPQLLGRATSIGAYVKRGEESGYIKISLRGAPKDEQIIVMRKIDTHNKSEWLFNGKVVPKRDVLEIIKRFNIQVNNLTQFLPQDRVCEFAKLTPVQLLEETEKAVGDPQLPVQHRALIEKSHELKKIQCAVEKNGDTLNQLKALNAEQEKDVERVRQRAELLEKVESMKKKLPWLKYDMKKAKYMEAKEQEKGAKKKLDEAAITLNEFSKPIEKKRQEKAMLDAKRKKLSSLVNDNVQRRMDFLEKANQAGVQVQGKYREMEDLRRQEQSRQQRILKAKEDLAAAELDLQNLPAYEHPKSELENLGAQILELGVFANQKRLQMAEKEKKLTQTKLTLRQCSDRLKDMENKNNKLLLALRNSGAEKIFEAYEWLQQHRHELNKEVYGPVLLEVNVPNRVHANYLEGQVPNYIWKSFITQDAGDRDFLVRNLRLFDVPVLNYVSTESQHKEPVRITEEMRALGISNRLDQVFDAPKAVMEVLTSQCGLEYSYIGSKETDQKADEVEKLGISDFWTSENHYRWNRSRYGGHVSASVEPVFPSRLLSCSSDAGEFENLRSRKMELEESVVELEESRKSLQTEQRLLEDKEAELHKQREEIISIVQHEKRKRREMESRVDQRRRRLESIEKEGDQDTVMAKLVDQAASLNGQRVKYAIEIKNLLLEAISYKWSYAEKHMAFIELDAKIRDLEVDLKQQQKFAEQASLQYEYCKQEVEDCRKELSDAKRHAESIAIITPELERGFLEMPTTIEELEATIQDNISQANSILFLNQNILQEYEHRQKQIEGMDRKLEADKKELKRCLREIDALKANWLPTLRNLVAQINETFSHNFQEMAVAGEVSLDEHDTDFDQYGILIKVKFRQTGQLEVLSAHHQSGGERSVSTILYLVSLQDLTNCPFRVVDEINQGMDPINERKMFQQLVRAASQPNTPQCFLLTPKLLPDLQYSEACSILNIMNGPWIEQPSKVWSSGDSWGTVTGLVGQSHC
ncbi:structural maintenance of chromosomes protein 5 isoform X2 [Mangifera indica]|uniref:structural maintenance of chromosomes protein 5 isoform X2 n=1 Tax=Mangifera indica TaxID=29780 RepID=UPI001CFBCD55|nr:structural maintenance of chromosomes protein 5 isoform X2 [Mangifera indica]